MQLNSFNPIIYPFKLWVIVDNNPENLSKYFLNYDESPITDLNKVIDYFDAFTLAVMNKKDMNLGVVIFFTSKEKMTVKNIAHECSHATKILFEHIGAEITQDETFEYALGWMAECCEQVKLQK